MRTAAATPGLPSLADSLEILAGLYPPTAPPVTDPLALIVWENIGYLIADDRRQSLFDELRRRIGLEAAALAAAPEAILLDIASRGGMRPAERAKRLRRIGEIALEAGGDLRAALDQAGSAAARRLLKRFPGIGDPGVDKILLFSGIEARPALESNGVRALARLGHAVEGASYAKAHGSATGALRTIGEPKRERLIEAWRVLRAHGKALCKRAAPLCEPCPLDSVCAHQVTKSL